MPIRFDHPEYLLLLLLALPVIWLGRRSLASLERGRQWAAIALRLSVLCVLILMLAGLQTVRWHSELTVIAVADRSESVRRFAKPPTSLKGDDLEGEATTIEQWIDRWLLRVASDRKPDDRLGLVTFDGRPTVRAMPSPGISLDSGLIEEPREGTDIASAVRQAMAMYSADTGKRMVLVSDGLGATGDGADTDAADLLAAAREAAAAGVPIDVLPIDYELQREVMIDGVYAPIDARQGQTISLRVVLRAASPAAGLLHVMQDDLPLDLDLTSTATAMPITEDQWVGDLLVKRIDIPLDNSGANRFEALFEPAEGADAMPANNRGSALTLVSGKGKLLILSHLEGASSAILPDALAARGIESVLLPPHAMPQSPADLQRYDAVVLQNVPNEMIAPQQQKMLARYVNDLGGGLVMIGGPDSFGAGGWANTPVDRILPVNCEIPKQTMLPTGALVLVIDRSGSMGRGVEGSNATKQEVANEAAVLAVSTLFSHDIVGVLAFSNGNTWVSELGPYNNPAALHEKIKAIGAGGGTQIFGALREAVTKLAELKAGHITVKHIVMLTDGQGAGGDYDSLLAEMKQENITLSTIGVGTDIDADLLARLAIGGGGAFHPVLDPNHLPQVFIKEARQVRKALIREQPFNPQILQTGSPIMAGIRSTPDLRGLVITAPKKDPRVFLPMLGPEGEPLFAHWQVGLGRTAAFTSDAHNRWAAPWLSWTGYADFWARTMRAIARPAASREFELTTAIRDDVLHVKLDIGTVAADPNRTVTGSVLAPDGTTQTIALDPVGPGVYEAKLPAPQEGHYLASAFVAGGEGKPLRYTYGGASRTIGAELRQFRSNPALLEQVASITGGRVLSPADAPRDLLFARDDSLERSRSVRPVWRPLLMLLIVLFMLDIANRRLAWDWFALLRRTKRKMEVEPKPVKAQKPSRKFDAPADFKPTGQLTEKLTPTESIEAKPKPKTSSPKPAGSAVTSRLLDAKRRAQKNMNDPTPRGGED